MTGFFKKLFKDDTEGITRKEEEEVIKSVAGGLMSGSDAAKGGSYSVITNKLPEFIADKNTAEAFQGFSRLAVSARTSPGMVRESNQDSVFTGEYKYYIGDRPLFGAIGIVADGMGGLSKGEIASSMAAASVSTYLSARISEYAQGAVFRGLPHGQVVLGHISDAIRNANTIIWSKGAELGESIGTTLTCTFLLGNIAYFGHAGDSRAYLIDTEKRSIEKITKDHSLVGKLVEMGHITEKESKTHPRRNEIYKMLGLRSEIDVDTYYRIINKNSVILIMSDGLWEYIDEDEMLSRVLKEGDISNTVIELVSQANKNGGHDNISLVAIKPLE